MITGTEILAVVENLVLALCVSITLLILVLGIFMMRLSGQISQDEREKEWAKEVEEYRNKWWLPQPEELDEDDIPY